MENTAIGMTQFKSIRKPKIKFPKSAPLLPNVIESAAAITLIIIQIRLKFIKFYNNNLMCTKITVNWWEKDRPSHSKLY